MDTCGFPKDNFWYYQSWWTDRPVLHILPHWNWPGREGQAVDVRALSNCDEVELFLNGRSMGRQPMAPQSELKWSVPYAPGALSAQGFKGGRVVAETTVETTGAPAAVQLRPDRDAIDANGDDVAVVTVSVADSKGRVVPVAGNDVSFELEGPGRILGVGNGDPSCHEPDKFVAVAPSRAVPIGGWRWNRVENPNLPDLPEEGVQFDDSAWDATDVAADHGTLGRRGKAIFRARFTVDPKDLETPVVELWFGRIAGCVAVYVDGRKVGGYASPSAPLVYDVKALLHPGENVVAVAAENYGTEPAGPFKGAELHLQEDPPVPQWRRSAFNGLAEVIVQSSRVAGTIRLTARSEGLDPATLLVVCNPAPARPAVP
jgi:beta-galactosidase